jgi:hypothetical protein
VLICNEGGHDPKDNVGNIGTIVRYNVSQNDHSRGINVAGSVNNASIYNNTIYVGKNEHVDLLLQADWKGWADGTYLYNNIFYVDGSAQFSHGVSRNPDGAYVTAPGFGSSKNTVFDSNVYYGHLKPADDPHALTSDPLLVSPGVAGVGQQTVLGYRLRPNSPALNSGKAIAHSERDFLGTPVPSCGGGDRGAFQSDACQNKEKIQELLGPSRTP